MMRNDKDTRARERIDRMIRRWSRPKLDLLIERAKHFRKGIGGRPTGSTTDNKINNAIKAAARTIRDAAKASPVAAAKYGWTVKQIRAEIKASNGVLTDDADTIRSIRWAIKHPRKRLKG